MTAGSQHAGLATRTGDGRKASTTDASDDDGDVSLTSAATKALDDGEPKCGPASRASGLATSASSVRVLRARSATTYLLVLQRRRNFIRTLSRVEFSDADALSDR
jgi:hypothetical protein